MLEIHSTALLELDEMPSESAPFCDALPPMNDSECTTQCFNCSRIYFGRLLTACPHCNSKSLQYYSEADLIRLTGARAVLSR